MHSHYRGRLVYTHLPGLLFNSPVTIIGARLCVISYLVGHRIERKEETAPLVAVLPNSIHVSTIDNDAGEGLVIRVQSTIAKHASIRRPVDLFSLNRVPRLYRVVPLPENSLVAI